MTGRVVHDELIREAPDFLNFLVKTPRFAILQTLLVEGWSRTALVSDARGSLLSLDWASTPRKAFGSCQNATSACLAYIVAHVS
jgi:hypothetical protein